LRKLGFIVNPIAGMGGRVGLKGTDGWDIVEKAKAMGAMPGASERAAQALSRLDSLKDEIELWTCAGDMGESVAFRCGLVPAVVETVSQQQTMPEDTLRAAKSMAEGSVDLLLFAGGDGTARDVLAAVDDRVPVLGIPAGVKMHSAVFAVTPLVAGELAGAFLQTGTKRVMEAEVMDIDEEQYRQGHVSAKLYGYVKVPCGESQVQGLKVGSPGSERFFQEAIAQDVIENMEEDVFYVFGPGTTTAAVMKKLGLEHTLLGFDLVVNKQVVEQDLNEADLYRRIRGKEAKIVLAPIGGQGFLFGRGNQQVSPRIIREIGKDNVQVVCTQQKLHSLRGRPFRIDTGDPDLDRDLIGPILVVTGYRTRAMYRVQ
jgi:predicted polyphosphate/ATP-dependent NAD kinase